MIRATFPKRQSIPLGDGKAILAEADVNTILVEVEPVEWRAFVAVEHCPAQFVTFVVLVNLEIVDFQCFEKVEVGRWLL